MPPSIPEFIIRPEALPAAIRELAEAIGDSDALRLIGQHGGARVNVPKKASEDHPLRMGLSAQGFDRLVARYGGGVLDLPKGDAYLRNLRHDQVRQCREHGLKIDDIAEVTGYTRRHVINILGGHGSDIDTATMDLFGDEPEAPESHPGQANDPFGLGARRR